MQNIFSLFFSKDKTAEAAKVFTQSFFFRVTGLGIIFLSQVLLARIMGTKGYGDYTVILSALSILLVVSLFGFDTSILRFLPSAISKKEFGTAYGVVRFSYRVITFLSIVCCIAIFLFLLSKSKKFNINFAEAGFWTMLLLPFLAFLYQANAVLRALNRVKTSMLSVYFLLPVSISLVCLVYYYFNQRLTVDATMLMNLLCTVVICFIINRRAGKSMEQLVPVAPPENIKVGWIKVSSVLFLTNFLSMLLKQSDILIVSILLGNSKAGIYAVASRLATLVALGLQVSDYTFTPKIPALWEKHQYSKLQNGIRDASRQILIISIPVAIILLLSGKILLGFFGENFTVAYLPLVILVAAQLVNSATGIVGGMLTMTGKQYIILLLYMLAVFTQLVLNFLLVPWLGITGAALGSAIALVVLNVGGYIYVKRKMKISAMGF